MTPTKPRMRRGRTGDESRRLAEKKNLFSIHLTYLPTNVTENDIIRLCGGRTKVADIFISGGSRLKFSSKFTFGFVRFSSVEEAVAAYQKLDRVSINGTQICASYAKDSRDRLRQGLRAEQYDQSKELRRERTLYHILRTTCGEVKGVDFKSLVAEIQATPAMPLHKYAGGDTGPARSFQLPDFVTSLETGHLVMEEDHLPSCSSEGEQAENARKVPGSEEINRQSGSCDGQQNGWRGECVRTRGQPSNSLAQGYRSQPQSNCTEHSWTPSQPGNDNGTISFFSEDDIDTFSNDRIKCRCPPSTEQLSQRLSGCDEDCHSCKGVQVQNTSIEELGVKLDEWCSSAQSSDAQESSQVMSDDSGLAQSPLYSPNQQAEVGQGALASSKTISPSQVQTPEPLKPVLPSRIQCLLKACSLVENSPQSPSVKAEIKQSMLAPVWCGRGGDETKSYIAEESRSCSHGDQSDFSGQSKSKSPSWTSHTESCPNLSKDFDSPSVSDDSGLELSDQQERTGGGHSDDDSGQSSGRSQNASPVLSSVSSHRCLQERLGDHCDDPATQLQAVKEYFSEIQQRVAALKKDYDSLSKENPVPRHVAYTTELRVLEMDLSRAKAAFEQEMSLQHANRTDHKALYDEYREKFIREKDAAKLKALETEEKLDEVCGEVKLLELEAVVLVQRTAFHKKQIKS